MPSWQVASSGVCPKSKRCKQSRQPRLFPKLPRNSRRLPGAVSRASCRPCPEGRALRPAAQPRRQGRPCPWQLWPAVLAWEPWRWTITWPRRIRPSTIEQARRSRRRPIHSTSTLLAWKCHRRPILGRRTSANSWAIRSCRSLLRRRSAASRTCRHLAGFRFLKLVSTGGCSRWRWARCPPIRR